MRADNPCAHGSGGESSGGREGVRWQQNSRGGVGGAEGGERGSSGAEPEGAGGTTGGPSSAGGQPPGSGWEPKLFVTHNGQGSPCLDLRRVPDVLAQACVGTDLIIIEGMGRWVGTLACVKRFYLSKTYLYAGLQSRAPEVWRPFFAFAGQSTPTSMQSSSVTRSRWP